MSVYRSSATGRTLGWITDPHFNFLKPPRFEALLCSLERAPISALLLGGDLAEAPSVVPFLAALDARLPYPVYFVLGNHDYYRGSIAQTRSDVGRWVEGSLRTTWLAATDAVSLTDSTGLVGHSGWGDARAGDFLGSRVRLNDYRLIDDLSGLDRPHLSRILNSLGDDAAAHLKRSLAIALDRHSEVLVLTHVPPFVEACWHEGSISDDQWLPHFTCLATGQVLLDAADAYPNSKINVLCGHTHGSGHAQLRPNLTIVTGGARYGHPALQPLITIS